MAIVRSVGAAASTPIAPRTAAPGRTTAKPADLDINAAAAPKNAILMEPRRRSSVKPGCWGMNSRPRDLSKVAMSSFRISSADHVRARSPANIQGAQRPRAATMSHYTVVIPSATPGAAVGRPPYATLDDDLKQREVYVGQWRRIRLDRRRRRRLGLTCRAGQIQTGCARRGEPFVGSNERC
jgi:hypothetical protein